jgi:hypothetical protein
MTGEIFPDSISFPQRDQVLLPGRHLGEHHQALPDEA